MERRIANTIGWRVERLLRLPVEKGKKGKRKGRVAEEERKKIFGSSSCFALLFIPFGLSHEMEESVYKFIHCRLREGAMQKKRREIGWVDPLSPNQLVMREELIRRATAGRLFSCQSRSSLSLTLSFTFLPSTRSPLAISTRIENMWRKWDYKNCYKDPEKGFLVGERKERQASSGKDTETMHSRSLQEIRQM